MALFVQFNHWLCQELAVLDLAARFASAVRWTGGIRIRVHMGVAYPGLMTIAGLVPQLCHSTIG